MTIIITLLLLSTNIIADCVNINNFESNPKLLGLEIKDQGDMSTCYAHTLADLYNSDQSKNISDKMHPYWIAYKHKNKLIHWSPKDMDFSLLSWAWSDMVKKYSCNYEHVDSIISKLKSGVDYSDDQLFYLLKIFFKFKGSRNILNDRSYTFSLSETLSFLKENSFDFPAQWLAKDIKKIINPLRVKIRDLKLFKFFRTEVFHSCKAQLSKPSGRLINSARSIQSNNTVLKRIGRILKRGKSLAIGYCSIPVIKADPSESRDIKSKIRIFKAFAKGCSAHYSMLVGSRSVANRCELLVRNSYGKDFWASKNSSCLCENNKNKKQFNCNEKESKGHTVLGCWINSNKLLNNTFDLSYYK